MDGDIDIYPEDLEQSPEEFYLFLMKLNQTYQLTDLSELYDYCKENKPTHCNMVKGFAKDFNIRI